MSLTTTSPTNTFNPFFLTPDSAYPIPLTTIFTPPSDCFGHIYTLQNGSNDSTHYSSDVEDESTGFLFHGFTASCYPSGAVAAIWFNDDVNEEPSGYFSPGICPYGFTTAQASYNGQATNAFCCPTSWTIYDEVNQLYDCSFTGNPTVTIVSGNRTHVTTNTLQFLRGLSVFFASSDLSRFTSIPSSAASSKSTPTSSFVSSSSHIELSTSAKVGISIGAVIGAFVAICVVGVFLQRRLYKRSHSPGTSGTRKAELPGQGKQMQEIDSAIVHEVAGIHRSLEIDGDNVHEVTGLDRSQELDSAPGLRAELDGNWQGWEAPTLSASCRVAGQE